MSKHTVIIKRVDKPGKDPIYMELRVRSAPQSSMVYSRWERASKDRVKWAVMTSGRIRLLMLQDWDGTKDEFLVP